MNLKEPCISVKEKANEWLYWSFSTNEWHDIWVEGALEEYSFFPTNCSEEKNSIPNRIRWNEKDWLSFFLFYFHPLKSFGMNLFLDVHSFKKVSHMSTESILVELKWFSCLLHFLFLN